MSIGGSVRAVESEKARILPISMTDSGVSIVVCRTPETLTLRDLQQSSSPHEQFDQAAGHEHPVLILVEAAVSNLGLRGEAADGLALTAVGRVAPDPGLVPVQQVFQHLAVVHIGSGRDRGVDQFAPAVHADMQFHAEVPLVALLGVAHLRITLALFVLGRACGIDDGGIHNRATADLQAVLLQIVLDQYEQLLAELVRFQQMTELSDRGLTPHRLPAQIDTDEAPHRRRVVQALLGRRVGQVEPVLQKVNPEHPLDADRAASGDGGLVMTQRFLLRSGC